MFPFPSLSVWEKETLNNPKELGRSVLAGKALLSFRAGALVLCCQPPCVPCTCMLAWAHLGHLAPGRSLEDRKAWAQPRSHERGVHCVLL